MFAPFLACKSEIEYKTCDEIILFVCIADEFPQWIQDD
jgi:hypothetical protein